MFESSDTVHFAACNGGLFDGCLASAPFEEFFLTFDYAEARVGLGFGVGGAAACGCAEDDEGGVAVFAPLFNLFTEL